MGLINIEGKNFRNFLNKLIGLTPSWLVGVYLIYKPFKVINLFPLIYSISYFITALLAISFINNSIINRIVHAFMQFSLALFELFFLLYIDNSYQFTTISFIYFSFSLLLRIYYKQILNLIITIIFYIILYSQFGNYQHNTLNIFITCSLILIFIVNFIQLLYYIKLRKASLMEQIRPYSAVLIHFPLLAIFLFINKIINSDIFFLFSIAFFFNISYNSEQNQTVGAFIHPNLNKSYSQQIFLTNIIPLNLVYILISLFYYYTILNENRTFNFNPIIFIFIYFIITIIQGFQFVFSIPPYFFRYKPRVSITGPFDYLISLRPLRSNDYFTLYAITDMPMFQNTINLFRPKKNIDLYSELSSTHSNVIIMRGEQTFLNARFSKKPFLLAFTNGEKIFDEFQRKSPLNLMNNNVGNYTGQEESVIKASDEIIKNLKVLDCLELNNIILSKNKFQDLKIYNNVPFDVAYLHQRIISTADKQLRTLANLNFIEITLRYIYFIRCAIDSNKIEMSQKLSFGYIVSCCEKNPALNLENHKILISNYIDSKKCLTDIGWSAKFGEKMNVIELLKVSNYIRNKVLGHGSVGTVNEELLYFTEFVSLQILYLCGKFCNNIYFYEKENDCCKIYSGSNSRRIHKITHKIIRFKSEFYDSEYLKFHEGYLYVYDGTANNGKREYINYTNGKRIRPDVIQI